VAAVFLDPASAHPVIPIHPGDGLSAHFVQISDAPPCCNPPDAATADARATLQQGNLGVTAAVDQMVNGPLVLGYYDGTMPLPAPGAAHLTGFLRVDQPGVLDFRVSHGNRSYLRLRIGDRIIIEDSRGFAQRSASFPVAGLYPFEITFAYNQAYYPYLQVQMAPGVASATYGTPYVPPAILYKTTDTDGDGITDSVETAVGLNPNDPGDLVRDDDGDGLTGLQEFRLGTRVDKPDTDGDGLNDGEETVLGVDGVLTDPLRADPDHDGLLDGEETLPGADGFVTNPFSADTDGDGNPDATDIIPVEARAEVTATTPVVRPGTSRVTVQLRHPDGRPIAKAGVPLRIGLSGLPTTARFAGVAIEGTLVRGGSGNYADMLSSANGRVTIDLQSDTAQVLSVIFSDYLQVGIHGQLFFTDFESGDGGFTQTSGSAWEFGTPTSGPGSAASGTHAWATGLAGNYPLGQTAVLQSPLIQVPSGAGPLRVHFRHAFDFGDSAYGQVAILENNSPQSLFAFWNSNNGYDDTSVNEWNYPSATTRILFVFSSVGGVTPKPGWYIDDVELDDSYRSQTSVTFQ
jgi:hypothetical protein